MEQNTKQLAVEKIKTSSNVLITVSANPSVDDLSAAIGFSLLVDKLGKHASAVFSGNIPPAIRFLEPDKRLDKDVGSLRDFIIALDKSKADKLRYKVDGDVVRIFITPYKSMITQDDLSFTQGDFNIDVVVALGVNKREDIDAAIKAHGRILHDAAVITINAGPDSSDLGNINWQDPTASSLCEMLVSISESFGSGLLDEQISTAFLTGIVAETERFSNPKTSPKVMTMSAQLMAAGANQQLIASNLIDTSKLSLLGGVKEIVEGQEEPNQIKIDHDGQSAIQNENQEGSSTIQSPALPPPQAPTQPYTPLSAQEISAPEAGDPKSKSLKDVENEISNLVQESPKITQEKVESSLPPPAKSILQESGGQIDEPLKYPTSGYSDNNLISKPKGRGPHDFDENDPLLGGTFNATSQLAHEENIEEQKTSVNRKLLSHPSQSVADETESEEKPVYKAGDIQPLSIPSQLPPSQPAPSVENPISNQAIYPQPIASTPEGLSPPPVMQVAPEQSQSQVSFPPVADGGPTISVDEARKAVEQAMADQPFDPSRNPIESIGSQSLPVDGSGSSGEIGIDQDGNLTTLINHTDDDSHNFPMPPQV